MSEPTPTYTLPAADPQLKTILVDQKVISDIRDLHRVQRDNASYSPYMTGLYNGLELALAIIEGRQPLYLDVVVNVADPAPLPAPVPCDPMMGLTEGRIIHYVMPDGQHRPALVVRVWRTLKQVDPNLDPHVEQEFRLAPPENGCCNLTVFPDWSNDKQQSGADWEAIIPQVDNGLISRTSVLYSEEPKPYTWHWIEPA